MGTKINALLLLSNFLLNCVQSQFPNEYFTSVANLEYLLESEEIILQRMSKYINLAEEKVKFLKRQKETFTNEIKDAKKDKIKFLSNPINAFLMTKRLVKDYAKVDALMQMGLDVKLIDNSTILPTDSDYLGIANSLAEMQELYQLDTADLARGEILGSPMRKELNSDECYAIGSAMSHSGQYKYGVLWLKEALKRWKNEDSPGVSKVQILDYVAYSLTEDNMYKEATEVNNELLKLESTHERGLERVGVLKQWLELIEKYGPKPVPGPVDRGLYHVLCRGEYERPVSQLSILHCRWDYGKSSFTRIAPFKMEEVSLDPHIVIYYDVISSKEIDKLIKLGRPQIQRSMVGQDDSVKEVSRTRTSQNSWLYDIDDPLIAKISKRTADITRLNMKGYDGLQLNNYGIGGKYDPHFDWSEPIKESEPVFKSLGLGNRIATLMFYLSDVELGGATVFPKIGVGVFPKKGSAIFWYNLLHDGTGDTRTLHGACPVLIGSKWVANKWIHEHHQEFAKPCGLHQHRLDNKSV
ncbi:prolyl 4-hydroxylase subunit alpha-2-like [Ochlerotatus camptorhynchus]|uniref:prolyl 4-hydroxylase subunit alpha-2-like n=1 Tax=Ochlerotatus camptorhynchus TaxID=644619 RepID=UPI0031E0B8C2